MFLLLTYLYLKYLTDFQVCFACVVSIIMYAIYCLISETINAHTANYEQLNKTEAVKVESNTEYKLITNKIIDSNEIHKVKYNSDKLDIKFDFPFQNNKNSPHNYGHFNSKELKNTDTNESLNPLFINKENNHKVKVIVKDHVRKLKPIPELYLLTYEQDEADDKLAYASTDNTAIIADNTKKDIIQETCQNVVSDNKLLDNDSNIPTLKCQIQYKESNSQPSMGSCESILDENIHDESCKRKFATEDSCNIENDEFKINIEYESITPQCNSKHRLLYNI